MTEPGYPDEGAAQARDDAADRRDADADRRDRAADARDAAADSDVMEQEALVQPPKRATSTHRWPTPLRPAATWPATSGT